MAYLLIQSSHARMLASPPPALRGMEKPLPPTERPFIWRTKLRFTSGTNYPQLLSEESSWTPPPPKPPHLPFLHPPPPHPPPLPPRPLSTLPFLPLFVSRSLTFSLAGTSLSNRPSFSFLPPSLSAFTLFSSTLFLPISAYFHISPPLPPNCPRLSQIFSPWLGALVTSPCPTDQPLSTFHFVCLVLIPLLMLLSIHSLRLLLPLPFRKFHVFLFPSLFLHLKQIMDKI